ncbi:MAG: acyl-CoA dehydrogenase, partial [Solirubrobacterales bacterium]|nr:acyl-CoA dehydrogenase [Solirubrobacterales bacterium]
MSVTVGRDEALLDDVRTISRDVAAKHADSVDREARFPAETIEALREKQALSAFVPQELGGGGVSFQVLARSCYELGRSCGASAMVFAMHQIQVATIVRHLDDAPWFESYLRDVVGEQRLIASVTSEVGTGGDMGRSIAGVEPLGDGRARFEKQAPTVSYGAYAD